MKKYLMYNEYIKFNTGGIKMKRFLQGAIIAIVSVGFLGSTSQAQAACPEATITNTGPGSTNVIECVSASEVAVTCTNNIYVVTSNSQNAGSGDGTDDNNTTSGNVITGSATNENGTVVQIGATCVSQTATPTTPTTPSTPMPVPTPAPQTGLGNAKGSPAQPVASLPNTANSTLVQIIGYSIVICAILLAVSGIGLTTYRQFIRR